LGFAEIIEAECLYEAILLRSNAFAFELRRNGLYEALPYLVS
jgi:hypothetical protein